MINVHEGGGSILLEANKFINAHTIVECGGYGFVVLNRTSPDFPLTAGCCIGRSGPAAFGKGHHHCFGQIYLGTAPWP